MGLKDWKPETREVVIGRGSNFHVRGLSLNDITTVLRTHSADIERIVEMYNQIAATNKKTDIGSDIVGMMLTDAPSLAAKIIASVCDEEGVEAETLVRLPIPASIDALTKIMALTFEEVGGVKKFARVLLDNLNAMGFSIAPSGISMKVVQGLNKLKQASSPSTTA